MAAYSLTATVPRERYDFLLYHLHSLGMLGCEERDAADGITLLAYFRDEQTSRTAAQVLNTGDCTIEKVEEKDWLAEWRKSMKPARLARDWYVSPVWLPPPKSARYWIKIEPKMAFGTGHHETTRLAAQAIIARKPAIIGKRVLDIGTGSGVLCFVAGLCGARFCLGVEIDPCCRENMAENSRQNRQSGSTGFLIGGITSLKVEKKIDLIVMNMILAESAPLLENASGLLAPAGSLIWSGILTDEYEKAVELAEKANLSLASEKKENEWWCGTFGLNN